MGGYFVYQVELCGSFNESCLSPLKFFFVILGYPHSDSADCDILAPQDLNAIEAKTPTTPVWALIKPLPPKHHSSGHFCISFHILGLVMCFDTWLAKLKSSSHPIFFATAQIKIS
ncbi:hypothetical protein HZ326_28112 [Fusarium oxysporum f. sp. albedinis]|nr:hypothetical protein HZ326_28112 [Fusarium oxysporum f. sp. albedinis]